MPATPGILFMPIMFAMIAMAMLACHLVRKPPAKTAN